MGKSLLLECNLAEFQAVKNEIGRRSGYQADLVRVNAITSSAIATLPFAYDIDNHVLLLIPILSSIIGLCWTDHANAINMLAVFVRDSIKPKLANGAACNLYEIADYERIATSDRWGDIDIKLVFLGPFFLLFGLIPLLAGSVPFLLSDTVYDLIFFLLLIVAGFLWSSFTYSFWRVALRSPKILEKFHSILSEENSDDHAKDLRKAPTEGGQDVHH